MTKTHLIATFANGEIVTRKTTMKLTHAWRAFGYDGNGVLYVRTGFSGSENKAHIAAAAEVRYFTHNPSGIEVVAVTVADADFEKREKAEPKRTPKSKGFRVRYRFGPRRPWKFFTGTGRAHTRYDTREAAEAVVNSRHRLPGEEREIVE